MIFAGVAIFALFFPLDRLLWVLQSSPALLLVAFIIGGLAGGTVAGAIQRSALKNKASWANAWFWATVVSWGCAAPAWWAQYQFLGGTDHFSVGPNDGVTAVLILCIMTGVILGTVQWVIMRRYVMISFLWILTTTASWLLAPLVGIVVAITKIDFGTYGFFTLLLELLAPALIIGLGPGLAQPILIGHSISPSQSEWRGNPMEQSVRRPLGVTILAVLAFVIGVLGLLLGALDVYEILDGVSDTSLIFWIIIILILAAAYIAFGFGAWILKRWARLLGMGIAAAWILVQIVLLFMYPDYSIVYPIIFAILSAIILYYLMTPNVRRAFGQA
jgi:hypothetical protein